MKLRPATEVVGDMNSQGPVGRIVPAYRDPRDPEVQEELARERAAKRLEDPVFRLEALEHRVAHIEDYIEQWSKGQLRPQFTPLMNEDLV